jgi:alpha-glucosidase (family GH31 glycosyl hydrolase)
MISLMRGTMLTTLLVGVAFTSLGGTVSAAATTAITAGNARFEFLTPSLVRMEYSPDGHFVDAPTAVVQQRQWPAVAVHSSRKDGWLVASTTVMTLRYHLGAGAFDPHNLQVSWKDGSAPLPHPWHPGQIDTQNLGGLTYSLDNISKPNLPSDGRDLPSPVDDLIPGIDVLLPPAKAGLLSRSGYAFIDDSRTPVWNQAAAWIEPRTQTKNQDWYLFTYGRDYRQVMQEYARLCGPIPMIPRYTLGPWITDFNFEYFPGTAETKQPAFQRYNQQYLEDEVSKFRSNHIPLDTLVLDFGWHNYGWQGGYDWSPLIPHPQQLLDWLHRHGVKVSLNDHPGYANTRESILSHQDSHADAALKALGQPLPTKPSFDLDVSGEWQFASDSQDHGVAPRWFAKDGKRAAWQPVHVGSPWQEQGFKDDHDIGWYLASVHLPAVLPAHLYLYLGEVADSYRLFVNGTEVKHSQVQWPRRLTYADLTAEAKPGQANEIVLRVVAGKRGGGILRGPVAIKNVPPPPRIYFDLSDKHQAAVSMDLLHKPPTNAGVDSWWVDGGSGAVDMPGLNKQLWTNKIFYDASEQGGKRGFILSRYGDWGSERYPAYFTGDTYSEWPVLAYEVAYTVRGGNVLVPYISHDIGGFHGDHIDFNLYARWVEFGSFSPFLRLHSAHENPHDGNARMPWNYGRKGVELVRKYFTLHTRLIPYIYSYTWQAHTQAMPILRPLYLLNPDDEEAYRHPHEYYFGAQLLVAPVLDASGDRTVYLPPGRWIDFFSGKRYGGAHTFRAHYAVEETPVFVREGAIIPTQPADLAWSDEKPLRKIILDIYGSGHGSFDLYEDDGVTLAYKDGEHAMTPLRHVDSDNLSGKLVIGPTVGSFQGQLKKRSWELRIHASASPDQVSIDGKPSEHWHWDANELVATVNVPEHDIREQVNVTWSSRQPRR